MEMPWNPRRSLPDRKRQTDRKNPLFGRKVLLTWRSVLSRFKRTGDGRGGVDNSLVVSMEINGVIYQGVLFAQGSSRDRILWRQSLPLPSFAPSFLLVWSHSQILFRIWAGEGTYVRRIQEMHRNTYSSRDTCDEGLKIEDLSCHIVLHFSLLPLHLCLTVIFLHVVLLCKTYLTGHEVSCVFGNLVPTKIEEEVSLRNVSWCPKVSRSEGLW